MQERIDALKKPIIDSLTTSGVSLSAVQVHLGETVFLTAASKENLVVLQQLYNMGMNPNHKHFKNNATALHLAAESGKARVVAWLLNLPEIEINCERSGDGCTPLYLAALHGHTNIVSLLLEGRNISINAARIDAPYATPLDIAAAKGHLACVHRLLAQPNIDPHLALLLSKKYKHAEVTACLLSFYLRLMLERPEQFEQHLAEQSELFEILCEYRLNLLEKLKNLHADGTCLIPENILSESDEADDAAYAELIRSIFFSEEHATHPLRRICAHNDKKNESEAFIHYHFDLDSGLSEEQKSTISP